MYEKYQIKWSHQIPPHLNLTRPRVKENRKPNLRQRFKRKPPKHSTSLSTSHQSQRMLALWVRKQLGKMKV